MQKLLILCKKKIMFKKPNLLKKQFKLDIRDILIVNVFLQSLLKLQDACSKRK